MADNTVLNAGTGGDTIATDDIAGIKHQRVKVQHGADGSATDVSSASPLPVDGSAVTQPVSGTVTANIGTAGTLALAVNQLPNGHSVTANAGTNLNTSTLALEATQSAMSGKLPATLGQKTKTTALGVTLASDEDALAVTIASQPLPTGAATEATLATLDGKVTICNTGAVVVSSGAITETNSGTIAGDTTSIDGKVVAAKTANMDSGAGTDTVEVQGIAVAASGGKAVITGDVTNGLDVDVTRVSGTVTVDGSAVTQPVSAVSLPLPAGASTSAVQTDGTQKAQIVDASGDVMDIAEEGVTLNTVAHKGPVLMAEASSSVPSRANGAVAPLAVNIAGNLRTMLGQALPTGSNQIGKVVSQLATDTIQDGTTALTPKFAIIDAATSGDNTLVAAVAGKKIRVLSYTLIAAGDLVARFESGAAGTALTGQMTLTGSSGASPAFSPVGHFETIANTLLNLELSAAVSVGGHLTYVEV